MIEIQTKCKTGIKTFRLNAGWIKWMAIYNIFLELTEIRINKIKWFVKNISHIKNCKIKIYRCKMSSCKHKKENWYKIFSLNSVSWKRVPTKLFSWKMDCKWKWKLFWWNVQQWNESPDCCNCKCRADCVKCKQKV